MHVGISLEPAVVLGLMGIEVVEDDMDGGVTIDSDDVVHEVEKLDAAATLFVSDSHLSGGNLEGSKQGRSAVTLVVMTMTGERPASGELRYPCARSSAWIEGFSSTQMTMAFSGGAI